MFLSPGPTGSTRNKQGDRPQSGLNVPSVATEHSGSRLVTSQDCVKSSNC